ncbi:LysR family transcriptional regulator [Nocardia sp. CDC153]|uniref:LysR family transcriptional regulator n=1 Tax=Nocardia sp. CDC153 TaxID=3112167 RepID=UPI002DB5CBD4|nr:LysR family transcriptional regulator [Nocardia sp. CDC153]MEC3953861.1 LysR family transcriptional regulator [Nocardia sp. CDC153]
MLIEDPARATRVDPTELEAFVVLAEELHFGRTAARLGLSQPRVSQLIRSLERRIGRRLVERTSRRVALNPLGEHLLARVRPAFADLQRALTETRTAARGLRVGFLGPYGSTLDEALTVFRARHRECPVTRIQIAWTDIYGPLRRGEVDVQVCLAPVEQPDLTVGPELAVFPRLVAIARSHPWSTRDSLDLEDLADLRVIGPHPDVSPEFARSFWPPATTPSGRPIPRAAPARTEPEMLSAVAHNNAVFATTTAMPSYFTHPEVAFVPLTGLPAARALLVWRSDNDHPRVAEFAALAAEHRAAQLRQRT